MYKVGDRVWCSLTKSILTLLEKEKEDDYYVIWKVLHENGTTDLMNQNNLHQSADDMFKELEYRLILEDSRYIILNYFNHYNLIKTELRINKEDKEYKLSNFTRNNQVFSAHISLKLHQAIHQKMVEFGVVENELQNK